MMARRLDVLARALDRVHAPGLLLRVRARLRIPYVTVLTYHRIGNVDDTPCDPDVIDATPEQFDWQMRMIADHFSVIGVDDLIAFFDAKQTLPPNPCLITFDDGYVDCYRVALPILQAHSIRATFFIATDFVDQRRTYWWDRINYLVRKSQLDRFTLTYPREEVFELGDQQEASVRRLLRIVKDEYGLDLGRFLDELATALDVPWGRIIENELADELVMTWGQVRALRDAGMDIGSHCRTHRVLTTIKPAELRRELTGSREILERELGCPIRSVAYPVGRSIIRSSQVVAAIREAGYALGFANESGSSMAHRWSNPLDIGRIPMDRELLEQTFRSVVAFPPLLRLPTIVDQLSRSLRRPPANGHR